jgi:hypothetical protein
VIETDYTLQMYRETYALNPRLRCGISLLPPLYARSGKSFPTTPENKTMIAPIRKDAPSTVLMIQARHRKNGFYVALIPEDLDAEQVAAAFQEAGINPQRVCEIDNFRETSNGVRVGFLPLPASH